MAEIIPDETCKCRICFDGESEDCGSLLSPCPCRGSQLYVHQSCILRAFCARGKWQDVTCPTCKHCYSGTLGVDVAYAALLLAREQSPLLHNNPAVGIALLNLASAYDRVHNLPRYRETLDLAYEVLVHTVGETHPSVAAILVDLASVEGELGRPDAAREVLERLLRIQETICGADSIELSRTLICLGNQNFRLGRVALAKDLFERALRIKMSDADAQNKELPAVLVNLSAACGSLGEHSRAEALLERALQIQEREFGPEHISVAAILVNLGNIRCCNGHASDAVKNFQRALAIEEREYGLRLRWLSLGEGHIEVAATLQSLAHAYSKLQDNAQQAKMLNRALAIKTQVHGPSHKETLAVQSALEQAHVAQLASKEQVPAGQHVASPAPHFNGRAASAAAGRALLAVALGLTNEGPALWHRHAVATQ